MALSSKVQLTFKRLFEVLAGLEADPARFFELFVAGRARPGAGQAALAPVGEGAVLRALLRPWVRELVAEEVDRLRQLR